VLYRTNAQSRQFEEILRRDRIPTAWWRRAVLRAQRGQGPACVPQAARQPADDVSFRRAINVPARGIGAGTVEVLEDGARALGVPLQEAAAARARRAPSRARARAVAEFLGLLDAMSELAAPSVAFLIDTVIERTGYPVWLEKSNPGQGTSAWKRRALVSAAAEYWDEDPEPSLLDSWTLRAGLGRRRSRPRTGVTLMTIHCAKGLEFRAVFLAGLEENVFPHVRGAARPTTLRRSAGCATSR